MTIGFVNIVNASWSTPQTRFNGYSSAQEACQYYRPYEYPGQPATFTGTSLFSVGQYYCVWSTGETTGPVSETKFCAVGSLMMHDGQLMCFIDDDSPPPDPNKCKAGSIAVNSGIVVIANVGDTPKQNACSQDGCAASGTLHGPFSTQVNGQTVYYYQGSFAYTGGTCTPGNDNGMPDDTSSSSSSSSGGNSSSSGGESGSGGGASSGGASSSSSSSGGSSSGGGSSTSSSGGDCDPNIGMSQSGACQSSSSGGGGGGSSSSGSGGASSSGGQQSGPLGQCGQSGPCVVKVDETGTPDGKDAFNKANQTEDDTWLKINEGIESNKKTELPWVWEGPAYPTGACNSLNAQVSRFPVVAIDVCKPATMARDLWAWVAYFLTAWGIWSSVKNALGGGGK